MFLAKLSTFALAFLLSASFGISQAQAAPDSFVYEGVLEDTNGPITTASTLLLRIYDPSLGCLLYEEQQSVTPATDGSFSVRVGSAIGAAKRTSNDAGLSMSDIFISSGVVRIAGANCTPGYSATSSESRHLVINVNATDLSPSIELSSAPFAISAGTADKIGSYASSKLLRSDGAAAVAALNDAKVTLLMNILNGTLANPSAAGDVANKAYVDTLASSLMPLSTTFAGDVSGTYSAMSVDKIKGKVVDDTGVAAGKVLKYDGTKWVVGSDDTGSLTLSNTKIWVGNAGSAPIEVNVSGDATLDSAGALTLAAITTGATKGLSNKVPQITYDAKGRITAVTEVSIDDTAKLPLAGGSMSGALNMGAQMISNAGDISMLPNKYFKLSSNVTDGTFAGQMWYDSGTGSIEYFDGTVVKSLGVAGAGIASINGLSSNSQTLAVGSSGTLPNWGSSSSTHTLNIPMASGTSVTGGLITKGEYDTFNSKVTSLSSTAPLSVAGTTTVPVVSLASGSYPFLKWNGSAWTYADINILDLKGTASVQQMPTTCTSAQTWYWNAALDKYDCTNISISNMASVSTAAAIMYVNSTGDDALCNGSMDMAYSVGQAPNCAFKTLQGALDKTPDIIRHNITLRITSDLFLTAANSTLGSIDKTIGAKDLTAGPMLIIEGYGALRYLDGNNYADTAGIIISAASRGVNIKNVHFKRFTNKAADVSGGLAVIENIYFTENHSAIKVSGGAHVMLYGNVNITLGNLTTDNRGIEIYQGSMISEAAMNIDLGTAVNNRGISVAHGEFGVEEDMTISQSVSGIYQSGIEASAGGQIYVEAPQQLLVTMNPSNSASTAITIRGGSLAVTGTLRLSSIGGRGLSCESGAKCHIYGIFYADTSSSNAQSFISVREASVFNAQGNFQINGTENSTSSAVEVTDNSVFKYAPYTGAMSFVMNRGGVTSSGSTAFRIKNGGIVNFESAYSPTVNISSYDRVFEASNGSSMVVASVFGGSVSGIAYVDGSSHFEGISGTTFPMPKRSCPTGMTAIGYAGGGLCIDNTDTTNMDYYNALNSCSNRGLKLCTPNQYAMYCASGNTLSGLRWGQGVQDVTCSPSSYTATNNTISSSYGFRCCQ